MTERRTARAAETPRAADTARTARLADVAARAGVSEATASRVLNGRPGVSEANRRAVLTAVDVLGYDRPARLEAASASLVGVIVPELVNPVFPHFAQALEAALAAAGHGPVICTQAPGGTHEDDHVRMLLDRGACGIVFVSGQHADATSDPARYRALRERGLPIVLVNGPLAGVDAPSVSNDDVASMDLAVRHLAELGHTEIGLAVGPERYTPVRRKVEGFRAAMREHLGTPPRHLESLVAHTVFSLEGGAAAAGRLVGRGVTAVVCGSDLMALGAIRQVRAMGREVPRDVSVVGYDDSVVMGYTDPPLTTVRQAVEAMAEAAAGALVDEIAGRPAPRDEYVFGPELVVRGSTGAAPGRG
ncbi:MAG TPA: LacI family DNA-binding transcriptional regulator [Phycicoccus sp.]|nr:LacI family DNA-binding transcriptional regulator [Phycicoccus sp.]